MCSAVELVCLLTEDLMARNLGVLMEVSALLYSVAEYALRGRVGLPGHPLPFLQLRKQVYLVRKDRFSLGSNAQVECECRVRLGTRSG